ncbi:hypothetical protein SLS55_006024 [Diplodia seriata]|uniref:Uncharacterized protein n=1 Tax=Diplodia seriata TaxID=420778 RepID=A0ABR3CD08_9PEZI
MPYMGTSPEDLRQLREEIINFAFRLWPDATYIRIRYHSLENERWCSLAVAFDGHARQNFVWSAPSVHLSHRYNLNAYEHLFIGLCEAVLSVTDGSEQNYESALGVQYVAALPPDNEPDDVSEDNDETEVNGVANGNTAEEE